MVSKILTKLKEDCATPLDLLNEVADAMTADMVDGLDVNERSDLKMLPSYVDRLPTGNEKGWFYALDLGGTNFRVLRVQLGGKDLRVIGEPKSVAVSIPQGLMRTGTSEELFDFIASRLKKFLDDEKEGGEVNFPEDKTREMGFTFSFPVEQTSIDSGKLVRWTKGFAVSGMEDKDVVSCLNEAMKSKGLNMRARALVNDTVATLAGARYWDNDVMVAVILGTGTNACYVERVNAIPNLQDYKPTSGEMIVNMEWGAFSTGLPLTEFDREMDTASINPGEQLYEKTISGMYLGEIVRRVLLKMAEDEALFGGKVPETLQKLSLLGTESISSMQQNMTRDLEATGTILSDVAWIDANIKSRKIVLEVCDTIAKRGGRLAAAGIVGILRNMEAGSEGTISGREKTVVAIDGSLYGGYPQYRQYLQEAVTELEPRLSKKIEIKPFKDASGIGAALLAATYSQYRP